MNFCAWPGSDGRQRITALVLLHGNSDHIEDCLRSVADQTLPADEIIIVHADADYDAAGLVRRVLGSLAARALIIQSAGSRPSRNLGIHHAHGDLIALLESGDVWYPSHLAELVEPFRQPRSRPLGWVYGNVDEIDANGRFIAGSVLTGSGSQQKIGISKFLRNDMYVSASASLISRQALDAVGGFDEGLSVYASDDLFVRLLEAGFDNVFVDLPLSRWRPDPPNILYSSEMAAGRMNYVRKLVAAYAAVDPHGRSCIQDLIIPRFLHDVAGTMRYALRTGNGTLADTCVRDISTLETFIPQADVRCVVRTNLITTVVIPLHDGAAFIEQALRSVLQQTLPADEIIVVDRGSNDDGPAIVRRISESHPITLLSQPGGGAASARNLGVRHAHGDLVAFLDQDDVWYPAHLAEMLPPFQEQRSKPLGWVYSDLDEIDRTGKLLVRSCVKKAEGLHPKTSLPDCLRRDMFVMPSAALVSRRAFEAIGGFDERLECYEDDDFFLRLLLAEYDNVYIDNALAQVRLSRGVALGRRRARSWMVYARKLIDAFPDKPDLERYPARDLIAPRFARSALIDAREALAACDDVRVESCFDNLRYLDDLLKTDESTGFARREPLISAIVPLYNGARNIERAIQSIFAQTLGADEIIVVDDGSTDNATAIVERLAETRPIRLIRQQNAGWSAACNIGVDHARGDLIAFLDQDGIWYSGHLDELVKPFRDKRSVELGWVYSNVDAIDRGGRLIHRGFLETTPMRHPKRDILACLSHDMSVLPSASLISRKAFLAAGGFDEQLSGYEADDLFISLLLARYDNVYLSHSLSASEICNSSNSNPSRTGVGHAAYLRKLIAQFTGAPDMATSLIRHLIAPRFFRSAMRELSNATRRGTEAEQQEAIRGLEFVIRHLARGSRIPLQMFLLPALRVPILRRLVMHHRGPLQSILQWDV
jgi:glycosyltransferase involved in cell wall biosynthesis